MAPVAPNISRRSFLQAAAAGPVYGRSRARRPAQQTKHVIFIVNGGGARKMDYYEDAALAPNLRRMAGEAAVFEQDHCDTVASHEAAFAEMVRGINYRYVESLRSIPSIMRKEKPRILVCRELDHDAGHEGLEQYLRAVRTTDQRIGTIHDWVQSDRCFRRNTAIIIRPEFGRDDEVNRYGQLHHSYGYYYTHRVASIFWGPDFAPGVDKTTVISRLDMAPLLAQMAAEMAK